MRSWINLWHTIQDWWLWLLAFAVLISAVVVNDFFVKKPASWAKSDQSFWLFTLLGTAFFLWTLKVDPRGMDWEGYLFLLVIFPVWALWLLGKGLVTLGFFARK